MMNGTVFEPITLANLATTGAVLATAGLATRLAHVGLTLSIRRVSAKRMSGRRTRWRWRVRTSRRSEVSASVIEIRRQHRIEATALALSRLATVVIWSTALVGLLHIDGISVTVAVGSAGFIGLILALGAQTSVGDYITGLHILLEDRFGEGDEIELVTANGRHLRGVVTAHGMFGTRIHADGATHHIANRLMGEVTNHSQLGVVTSLDVDHHVEPAILATAAEQAQASRPEMPTVVIDSVETLHQDAGPGPPRSRIHLRAVRPLGATDQHHFGQELRALIGEDAQAPPPE